MRPFVTGVVATALFLGAFASPLIASRVSLGRESASASPSRVVAEKPQLIRRLSRFMRHPGLMDAPPGSVWVSGRPRRWKEPASILGRPLPPWVSADLRPNRRRKDLNPELLLRLDPDTGKVLDKVFTWDRNSAVTSKAAWFLDSECIYAGVASCFLDRNFVRSRLVRAKAKTGAATRRVRIAPGILVRDGEDMWVLHPQTPWPKTAWDHFDGATGRKVRRILLPAWTGDAEARFGGDRLWLWYENVESGDYEQRSLTSFDPVTGKKLRKISFQPLFEAIGKGGYRGYVDWLIGPTGPVVLPLSGRGIGDTLFVVDGDLGTTRNIQVPLPEGETIFSIATDGEGLWVFDSLGAISRVDLETGELVEEARFPSYLRTGRWYGLRVTPGAFWIERNSSARSSIYRIERPGS